MRHSNQIIILK